MVQRLSFKVICYYTFWAIISTIYLFVVPPHAEHMLVAIYCIKMTISILWLALAVFTSKIANKPWRYDCHYIWCGIFTISTWGVYTCLMLDGINPIFLFDAGLLAFSFSGMLPPTKFSKLSALAYIGAVLGQYFITGKTLSISKSYHVLLIASCQSLLSSLNHIFLFQYKKSASLSKEVADEILNEVSHEIRIPLQGIISFSDTLLSSWKILSDNEKYGMVKVLYDNSTNLISYLSNILEKASKAHKALELQAEASEIQVIIEDALQNIEALCRHKNIQVKYLIDPDVNKQIVCDPFKIKQVLVNLLCNSIKYSSPDTQIQIIVQKYQEDEISEERSALFIVSDQGVGIAPEELQAIFLPFIQGSRTQGSGEQSTGYGLPLAAKIIKQHGGKIWAKNNELGASFYFTLPYKYEIETITNMDNIEDLITQIKQINQQAKKVLIVDDDITSLLSLQMLLGALDFEVTIATTGDKAIKLASEIHIDLILLDVLLPNINGLQVLKIIRANERYNTLPAIFLTGALDGKDGLESITNSWYLMKPYTNNQLINIITKALAVIVPTAQENILK